MADRPTDSQTRDLERNRVKVNQTDRKILGQTNRQTDRQTDRETDRQTDRPTAFRLSASLSKDSQNSTLTEIPTKGEKRRKISKKERD